MMAIHAQIAADAATARAKAFQAGRLIPSEEFEALQSLIQSATEALYQSLPASFQHKGQTYRLMVDIERARLAIFESMTAEKSILVAVLADN